jgi:pyruvate dehydrogenase (quinone)
MEDCDTLLMVGTSFPYLEFPPKPGQAHDIQIELDPMRIGLRYPVDVGLIGDSRRTLQALMPLVRPRGSRTGASKIALTVLSDKVRESI